MDEKQPILDTGRAAMQKKITFSKATSVARSVGGGMKALLGLQGQVPEGEKVCWEALQHH